MWNTVGRLLVRVRAERQWSQQYLADRLGVSNTLLARWESGERSVPHAKLSQLAQTLGVRPSWLEALWTPPTTKPLWEARSEKLPPYPVKGSLHEIAPDVLALARLSPAVEDEMEHAFPRDSALELSAAVQFLAKGEFRPVRLTDLGCRLLVVEANTQRAAGHLFRHAIVVKGRERTMVVIPQVSVIVVAQSMERRMDFLILWRGPRVETWVDLEIDSIFHANTANADARRAWGLGLPRLSFTGHQIESATFVSDVAAALYRLEKRHQLRAAS